MIEYELNAFVDAELMRTRDRSYNKKKEGGTEGQIYNYVKIARYIYTYIDR